ncbi:MAG: hypothetical protein QM775_13575 [Pirellulales bacterium]
MKRLLTWLALVAFCGISAVAIARVVRLEQEVPAEFDHAQLEAWLTAPLPQPGTPEAEQEEPDPTGRLRLEQQRQVRRAAWLLEQDFALAYDWSPFYKSLDAAARDRFQTRWNMLLAELFLQRARQFVALPQTQREAFFATQLLPMTRWYALDARGKHLTGPALLVLDTRFQAAVDRQDASAIRSMREFRNALTQLAADRLLKTILPGTGDKPAPPRARSLTQHAAKLANPHGRHGSGSRTFARRAPYGDVVATRSRGLRNVADRQAAADHGQHPAALYVVNESTQRLRAPKVQQPATIFRVRVDQHGPRVRRRRLLDDFTCGRGRCRGNVGIHDEHAFDSARQRTRQPAPIIGPLRSPAASGQAELHVAYAFRKFQLRHNTARGSVGRIREVGQLTQRDAHGNPSTDDADDFAHRRNVHTPERTAPRLFQVDEIDSFLNGDASFRRIAHADQEPGHDAGDAAASTCADFNFCCTS